MDTQAIVDAIKSLSFYCGMDCLAFVLLLGAILGALNRIATALERRNEKEKP
jgi:hypothetical protein